MKNLLLLLTLTFFSTSWVKAQETYEPPNGMSEVGAYSIFYENYKSESYDAALKFGRWIWKGMPETLEGYSKFDLQSNLRRLIKVYGHLSTEASDPSVGQAYADTALIIFENVYDKYGDDLDTYEWSVRKGRFYQTHEDYVDNAFKKAAKEYQKAFEMKPEEFTKRSDGYYVKAMVNSLMEADKKDEALALIDEAEPYASEGLKEYFNNARNQLFDSPDERIAFLNKQLKDDPENKEMLSELRDLYEQKGNNQKVSEISKKLYEIDPNYENTLALGESAMSDARYNEAIKYLEEALNKTDSDEKKAAISLNLSSTYMNSGQLQKARSSARTAIKNDSENGKPYIYIADTYAQAVDNCTNNRELDEEDRVVYWLVIDYLNKAKQVDSSVSSEADRKIQAYADATPTTEQKFFKNWEDGQTLSIDGSAHSCYGWISETTSVR